MPCFMFTSRRRAIKIYVYRNANSNVNQEAAKLLISRGNFLRAAATRRGATAGRRRCNRQEAMHVCMRANGAYLCLSVFRSMIYARGRSCRTLMSLRGDRELGRIVSSSPRPLERLTGPRDWKITGFSALAVDASGMKNYCGCRGSVPSGERPGTARERGI